MAGLSTERHAQIIDGRILTIRGEKVILDSDLASVYGVPTKALNQAVRRNVGRFPKDFRFQLSRAERTEVVTNCDHLKRVRFSRVRPWAFTEHGAIMVATVLNSPRAVEMSVFVVRAFVRLRMLSRGHTELAVKLDAIERRVGAHDDELNQVFATLRRLIDVPRRPRRQIGFSGSLTLRPRHGDQRRS
jgi:hypothetical protein